MKNKINVRYLEKEKEIYIKSNLFLKIKKIEFNEVLDKILSISYKKEVKKISSLDWRILIYINEYTKKFKLKYIAYFINSTFPAKNKKLNKYKAMYIKDCDTWSFKSIWFSGFHPAKYNNSFHEAFLACNYNNKKNNNELHLIKKNKDELISLSTILKENSKSKKLLKTKAHLISPQEIQKIISLEKNKTFLKAYKKTTALLSSEEYLNKKNHIEKINYFKEKVNIDTKLINNKNRGKTERNLLSEIYLLYNNFESYFLSRCLEINSSPRKFDADSYKFYEKNLKSNQIIYKSELNYKDTVYNKKIAIICPGELDNHVEKEIVKFDIIVYFNTIPEKTKDKLIIVNTSASLSILGSLIDNISKIEHLTTSFKKPNYFRKNDRILFYPNKFLFNSCPTALQRFLFDLVSFSPKKIKVFGATLYTKKNNKVYNNDYNSSIEKSFGLKQLNTQKDPINLAFNIHDPLANFTFTKYLFQKYSIEADPFLENLLSLSAYEYLQKLFNNQE